MGNCEVLLVRLVFQCCSNVDFPPPVPSPSWYEHLNNMIPSCFGFFLMLNSSLNLLAIKEPHITLIWFITPWPMLNPYNCNIEVIRNITIHYTIHFPCIKFVCTQCTPLDPLSNFSNHPHIWHSPNTWLKEYTSCLPKLCNKKVFIH